MINSLCLPSSLLVLHYSYSQHCPDFCSSLLSSHLSSAPSHPTILTSLTTPLCFFTYYLRCDASIAKLSTDMSSGEPRMIGLQKEVAELRSAVYVKVKELEAKVRCGVLLLTKMFDTTNKKQFN